MAETFAIRRTVAHGSLESFARRWAEARLEGIAWLDGNEGESFLMAEPVETRIALVGESIDRDVDAMASSGFWVGYVAYDHAWSAHGLKGVGASRHERDGARAMHFSCYDARLRHEHESGELTLEARDDAALARMERRLALRGEDELHANVATFEHGDPQAHRAAILRAKDAIGRGEIYQVNLARTWRAGFDGDAFVLWEQMRRASPVPLGLFYDAGDHQVLASTMERVLSWRPDGDGRGPLLTRPIKGTIARRGQDAEERSALHQDPKERAEHVMIVDLMRNDLGRVAEIGSVEVVDALSVEPFAKLHHLVSTVRCETRAGTAMSDVLRATFPPGSVTGAPKVRAVQLIEELEPEPRGIYCGAVGYIDGGSGELSLAVAIRVAMVGEGEVVYRAGGGLVEASDPDREVAETELKARAFLEACAALPDGRRI